MVFLLYSDNTKSGRIIQLYSLAALSPRARPNSFTSVKDAAEIAIRLKSIDEGALSALGEIAGMFYSNSFILVI